MGLLHSGNQNVNCPVPAHLTPDAPEKFIHNLTFHEFNMILSGSCTAVTCLTILTLMAMHATHFSNPKEQTKIMRISLLLPLYSIYSFLSICFPNAYAYLETWTEFFQGLALYNFLFLLCDFLAPDERLRPYFFMSLKIPKWRGREQTRDGLAWLRRVWYFVLQYPLVAFILAIVASITEARGTYCLDSNDLHFAYFWLNVISIISVALAIGAIILFYRHTKSYIAEHKPMIKFMAFKLMVGLVFLETILFTILGSARVLKPSATMTYADVHIGLPTLIICIQMIPFAFFFHYAYSAKPYHIPLMTKVVESGQYLNVDPTDCEHAVVNKKRYLGGPGGLYAWCALLNPVTHFREFMSTWNMFFNRKAESMYSQV
ncbi:hypothetical protein N7492_005944 [Penicillium capsulatum]|uniref:Uncharacterized protein n=1 Tax=Penicillium capsulatum TaxID=69766 RepID=A0A9W9LS58_9EURO|nr:hypothetical protein N7492_005944 [Penicillium capsulatum]